MNWDAVKGWAWVGAASVGLGVLITKFFDVLSAMLGPEVALKVVHVVAVVVISLLVAVASIIASWVITEVIKRVKWKNPEDWKLNKGRIWLCSITWNAIINGGFLLVMYQPLELSRHALIVLGAILVWTAVVCGVGLAAYDVFVVRLWHVLLLRLFPTKYVKLADGRVVKRPLDEPTNYDAGEKTQLPDTTIPRGGDVPPAQ